MNVQKIARRLLRATGWDFEGPVPAVPKCVAIAVPHTSNWDGVLMLAGRGGGPRHVVHDQGRLAARPDGADHAASSARSASIARRPTTSSTAMIAELRHRDRLWLVIPPEGTRSRTEYWKSGFYHIARGADVPLVLGYIDYRRKRIGLGGPLHLTGDVGADMDAIRRFYADKAPVAHVPADFGPIRLKDEPAVN
jgi:1-acyl-sn-glycerol-3-phosphate acyltransferase